MGNVTKPESVPPPRPRLDTVRPPSNRPVSHTPPAYAESTSFKGVPQPAGSFGIQGGIKINGQLG